MGLPFSSISTRPCQSIRCESQLIPVFQMWNLALEIPCTACLVMGFHHAVRWLLAGAGGS